MLGCLKNVTFENRVEVKTYKLNKNNQQIRTLSLIGCTRL